MFKSLKTSALASLLVLSMITPIWAQQVSVTTGAVQGRVTDSAGAAISGAVVTLTNTSRGFKRQAKTSDDGSYSFPLLQPSSGYQIEIESAGFRKQVINDISVRVTETADANAQLTAGAITEQVTVEASAGSVQTTNATLGGTLERNVISNLPIINRNPLLLLATDAGVVNKPGTATLFVNGNRSTANNFQLNGADANNFEFGSLSSVPTPNPDSIQEFRTQTSTYDATMGRGSGANISVISRSGTSQLHGNLLYLNRNDAFAANSFFSNRAGAPRPPLNRNHMGGSIGGPLPIGHKTFWFFNYEAAIQRNPAEVNSFYPVLPETRTAETIAAAYHLSPGVIDPVAIKILNLLGPYGGKLFPSVNGTLGTNAFFHTSATNISNQHQFTARVDHEYKFLGKDNRVGGTVFWAKGHTLSPLTFGQGSEFFTKNPVYTIQNTTVFNQHLINELSLGANVGKRDGNNHVNAHTVQEIGLNKFNADLYPEIPQINITGVPGFGTPTNEGPKQHTNSATIRDVASYVKGQHSFRFGGDIRWYQFNYDQAFGAMGSLSFSSFANFIQGRPSSRFITSGTTDRAFRAYDVSPFFQDDWRISPRLTLNLGLRYDWMPAVYEKFDRFGSFDFDRVSAQARLTGGDGLLAGYVFPESLPKFGTPGVPRSTLNGEDKNNWAPRLSFAYDVFGDGKMAVRGGYGINYVRMASIPALQLSSLPPFSTSVSAGFGGAKILSNPFPVLPRLEAFPILPTLPHITGFDEDGFPEFSGPQLSITTFDRNLRVPYVQNWNLTVQREVAKNWIVELSYVGNRGIRLYSTIYPNNALLRNANNPGALGLTTNSFANVDARVPFVGFSAFGIAEITSSASSNFHSGQATVTHQFSKGFYIKGAYTFSKSIDNDSASPDFDIGFVNGNQFSLNSNRGVSDHDVPHRFALTYVWDIPGPRQGWLRQIAGGWTTSGLLTYQQGFPFSVLAGGNLFSPLSGSSGFAHLKAGCDPRPNNRTHDNYINADCFTDPPLLTSGQSFGPLSPFMTPGDQTYTITPGGDGQLLGDLGRNTYRGPNQFRWDTGLYKKFFVKALGENSNFELRVDFFNVLNHPVFANPGTTFGGVFSEFSPSFLISATDNISRQTQFQIKFNF